VQVGRQVTAAVPSVSAVAAPATFAAALPVGKPTWERHHATYRPPSSRNCSAAPTAKECTAARQFVAPIQDPRHAEAVFKRSLQQTAITLALEEALALQPDSRESGRAAVATESAVMTEEAEAMQREAETE
jgi:hypothetical protein